MPDKRAETDAHPIHRWEEPEPVPVVLGTMTPALEKLNDVAPSAHGET